MSKFLVRHLLSFVPRLLSLVSCPLSFVSCLLFNMSKIFLSSAERVRKWVSRVKIGTINARNF